MKNALLTTAAAILLLALGFQLGRMTAHPEKTEDAPARNEPQPAAVDEEALTSWECNGTAIAPDSAVILNYKGERTDIRALANDSTVIARFSATACKPCVNALAASLRKFAAEHPGMHVALLLKGMALRDLYVLAPQFGPQFTLLACESLPADFDGAETPALFRLSADGRVRDHYTCRFGDYARTDMYLSTLK